MVQANATHQNATQGVCVCVCVISFRRSSGRHSLNITCFDKLTSADSHTLKSMKICSAGHVHTHTHTHRDLSKVHPLSEVNDWRTGRVLGLSAWIMGEDTSGVSQTPYTPVNSSAGVAVQTGCHVLLARPLHKYLLLFLTRYFPPNKTT